MLLYNNMFAVEYEFLLVTVVVVLDGELVIVRQNITTLERVRTVYSTVPADTNNNNSGGRGLQNS
jgi:hypothetical protein